MQLVNSVLPEVKIPIHCNSNFLLSKVPKNIIENSKKRNSPCNKIYDSKDSYSVLVYPYLGVSLKKLVYYRKEKTVHETGYVMCRNKTKEILYILYVGKIIIGCF